MNHPSDLRRRIAELWDEIPTALGPARADRLLELAHHLMEVDRCVEALATLETAEGLLVEAGDDRSVGVSAHNRAAVFGRLHRRDEQIEAEQASVAAYDRAQRRDLAGCSRMALAFYLRAAGHPKEALGAFVSARADFEDSSEIDHRANALLGILETQIDLGRFPAAARTLPVAMAAATVGAPVPEVAKLHELAAKVLEVRDGPVEACRELQQARAVWEALGDDDRAAACDIRMAVLDIGITGAAAATRTLKRLRVQRRAAGDVPGVAACDRGLGRAALERGRFDKALRRLEDSSTVFEACGLFAGAAEADVLAGRALAELGRSEEAIRVLRPAIRTLRALHRPLAERDARLALADILEADGYVEEARRELKRAGAIAKRAGIRSEL